MDSSFAGIGPDGFAQWTYFWAYQNGLRTFSPWNNLVLGKGNTTLLAIKGWQIELGQLLYLRGGSITYPGGPLNSTSGWGVGFDGLVKLLVFLRGLNPNGSFAQFVLEHLELQFNYARSSGGIFPAKPFESLDLVVR